MKECLHVNVNWEKHTGRWRAYCTDCYRVVNLPEGEVPEDILLFDSGRIKKFDQG